MENPVVFDDSKGNPVVVVKNTMHVVAGKVGERKIIPKTHRIV